MCTCSSTSNCACDRAHVSLPKSRMGSTSSITLHISIHIFSIHSHILVAPSPPCLHCCCCSYPQPSRGDWRGPWAARQDRPYSLLSSPLPCCDGEAAAAAGPQPRLRGRGPQATKPPTAFASHCQDPCKPPSQPRALPKGLSQAIPATSRFYLRMLLSGTGLLLPALGMPKLLEEHASLTRLHDALATKATAPACKTAARTGRAAQLPASRPAACHRGCPPWHG